MITSPLEQVLALSKPSKKDTDVTDKPDGIDHDEWQDNENMHGMGLTMNAVGHVHHGSLKIGHVVAVPERKNKFVGIHHPTGAMTDPHGNRAKAAMDLMNLHHYLPHVKKTGKDAKTVKMSGPLEEVLVLAGVSE